MQICCCVHGVRGKPMICLCFFLCRTRIIWHDCLGPLRSASSLRRHTKDLCVCVRVCKYTLKQHTPASVCLLSRKLRCIMPCAPSVAVLVGVLVAHSPNAGSSTTAQSATHTVGIMHHANRANHANHATMGVCVCARTKCWNSRQT